MTKPLLYAARSLIFVLFSFVIAATPLAAQEPAPCAACVGVIIEPGQTLLLPPDLHGVTILLTAIEGWTPALAAGVEAIRQRGGAAAILVTPPNEPTGDALTYALRVRLSELRSQMPAHAQLALLVTPALTDRRISSSVIAYADVLVSPSSQPVEGGRRWVLDPAGTLAEALAASARGGADKWILRVPGDLFEAQRLLAQLASAAAPPETGLVESVDVRGTPTLTADEIVARYQAALRRQTGMVRQTIATGTLTVTFEAPGFPAPVTVSSRTTMFVDDARTEFEQTDVRVNGLAIAGSGVPRLPIIEPERVASPPLAITLSDSYSYRRLDDEVIGGVRCYVIAFEPSVSGRSLHRGRAWIAIESFGIVRLAAAQTGLRGAIVASEQVDEFREVQPRVWLLARSNVHQQYEGAGHRTPIHRLLLLETHEVNPPDFAARLQSAYASSAIMLRDTPAGFRYLTRTRRGDAAGAASSAEPAAVEAARGHTQVRTLAGGIILDPNISVPLPFAGFSFVDFDLFGTGAQVNAFFGGSYGQFAFSVPSLGGTRWQLGGRAFAIAASYNDRAFRDGREIYAENLRQRPAHLSAWLLRPLSPRLTFRAGYELDYTRLRGAPETGPGFVVPGNQRVHGVRLALDGQRSGWHGSLWWNGARRTGWRRWGGDGDYDPGHADFQRMGAGLTRSIAATPRLALRFETAVMAGRDLDRFSRYAFGSFDNRLRGYPAALIRYDRGGVIRGSAAWAAGRFARLDGFVDTAVVRDRGYGTGYRNYTGVGAAVEAPGPFGLLTAAEWGYGVRGVQGDGGLGTHVIRLSVFKVF